MFKGLLGVLVLLGMVNGLSGLPRYFISFQEVAGCIMVAVFCSSWLKTYRGLIDRLVVLFGLVDGLSRLPR